MMAAHNAGGKRYLYTLFERSQGRWVKVFVDLPLKEVLSLMKMKAEWQWRLFQKKSAALEPGYEHYRVEKNRAKCKYETEPYEHITMKFRPKNTGWKREDGVGLCGDCPMWHDDKTRSGIWLYGWCDELKERTERCEWCRKGAADGLAERPGAGAGRYADLQNSL